MLPLSDSGAGGHCVELCLCPQQRIVRVWFNDGKHPRRMFGPRLPCNTRRWKRIFDRRNVLKRINARVERDFLLDYHFLRGKFAMHLRIAGQHGGHAGNRLGQQVKRFLAIVLDHQKNYMRAGLELLSKDICHEHLQLTKRMKWMVKKLRTLPSQTGYNV